MTTATASPQAHAATAASGTWGTAREVPNTATLNTGNSAEVDSTSCPSAGNCAAGGDYKDTSGALQAFVVNETNGTWGNAQEVPNTAILGISAQALSVSCPSAGNCAAVGHYSLASGAVQAFVVNETNGTWGNAQEIPNTGTLNTDGFALARTVSCVSAGNCAAGGFYQASGAIQAFVVNETNGTWGNAQEIPNTATLNTGGDVEVQSVSCASAGNCVAGGSYALASGAIQAFVVNETSGTWGNAEEVPNTATLNKMTAVLNSVSCAPAGTCVAGGSYTDSSSHQQAFVANRASDGTWGAAEEVPNTATLNKTAAVVNSVSCPATGNCSAGGSYRDSGGHLQAFVVDETSGTTWGNAQEVPNAGTLNTGNSAQVSSVSCPSSGNCSAGGFYTGATGQQPFVVDETSGTWGSAQQVPGTATLNASGLGAVNSVSCASAGTCAAGGSYSDSANHQQAFVANETATTAPSTASYTPDGPVRVLDTRNGTGGFSSPVGAGKSIALQITGKNGVPTTGVTAVVLNVTATGATASSFVTAYPDGTTRPAQGSNLNFTKGETIPNLVTVPVGSDGKVDFFNSAGTVNLIADLEGYYSSSGKSKLATAGPVRVLDTRNGTGGFSSPVGAGKSIALQITGKNGVPTTGVTAVVLNLTATGATASSFVTAYPDGTTRPAQGSNLNFTKGETIPNLVIVPVGSDGKVDLYNAAGTVNLIADLFGYYTTSGGSGLATAGPVRVLDTRNGTGGFSSPVGAGKSIALQITGKNGVPTTGVTAVVLNVTATGATASSHVTVYPDGTALPAAGSNLNFTAGETIPNLVIVPVGSDGRVDLYNAAGTVNLIADLFGYFES